MLALLLVVASSAPSTPITDSILPTPAPWQARFQSQLEFHSALTSRFAADTVRAKKRPKAIALSDGYGTRLKIHQIASYAMLPVFAAEFVVGQKLYHGSGEQEGLRGLHRGLALGIGGIFAVNTVTGIANWWETRKDPVGRTRRTVHALLMLAADAGFLATAAAAEGDDDGFRGRTGSGAAHHRALAEASISVSLLSSLMMWIWK